MKRKKAQGRDVMYIKQKELFKGLNKQFVKEIIDFTEKRSYKKQDVIFREGNHAGRFYVLLKGRVRLTVGEIPQVVFTVNHAGEAFGWSSLLGREVYAASAECEEATSLLRIDRVKFNMVLNRDPAQGLILIRRLAQLLGHRLHEAYKVIGSKSEWAVSYGTGQVVESPPAF
jgi:CRP-like cAMP-binding protein